MRKYPIRVVRRQGSERWPSQPVQRRGAPKETASPRRPQGVLPPKVEEPPGGPRPHPAGPGRDGRPRRIHAPRGRRGSLAAQLGAPRNRPAGLDPPRTGRKVRIMSGLRGPAAAWKRRPAGREDPRAEPGLWHVPQRREKGLRGRRRPPFKVRNASRRSSPMRAWRVGAPARR